jgi:hypothetical protein
MKSIRQRILHMPLAITLCMLFLLSYACKTDSGESGQSDYRLPNSAAILNEYNSERPDWDKSEKTEGPVDILVEDNLISITHDAYASSNIVTYYLQTDSKAKKLKSGHIEIAEVIYLEKSLIVNSVTDKNTMFFSVNSSLSPQYFKSTKGVKTFFGYGLGVRRVIKGMRSVDAYYCDCAPAGYPEGACPSSNSLSITCTASNEHGSCKVYCTGQTFACCGKRGE